MSVTSSPPPSVVDLTNATTNDDHINLGLWHREHDRHKEAETSFRNAISTSPNHSTAHAELADLLEDLGRTTDAEESYRRAISLNHSDPYTYIYFGILLRGKYQQQEREGGDTSTLNEAERCFRTAAELDPLSSIAFYNLAHILDDTNNIVPAEAAYKTCIRLDPSHSDASANLALLLTNQHRHPEALEAYTTALTADPTNTAAIFNCANLYEELGRTTDAEAFYRRVLELDPLDPAVHINLGYVLTKIHSTHPGQPGPHTKEACDSFRAALTLTTLDDTTRQRVQFELEVLDGDPSTTPHRASPDYVTAEFDALAATFDARLVDDLGYQGPTLLHDAIVEVYAAATGRDTPSDGQWTVVDFGCGTGLMGPLLKPWAESLHGIDLSPKMLEVAKEEGRGYDTLRVGDTALLLQSNDGFEAGGVDLLVAADVLAYLGELEEFFRAAAFALVEGCGWLAVTVEALEEASGRRGVGEGGGGWELLYSGRYAHSEEYVRRLAGKCGLVVERHECVDLRVEFGLPVVNHIFVLRRGYGG
mmetsp:Transcript_30379/g.29280  ORF Transcript_30379/g.29280 Transcript_30379/m.29280 type:complete len:534 (-) Transcript_30379:136-1737(-)